METTIDKITRKTGNKPTDCKCQGCQAMCKKQVCIGTPEDILKLINAGFAKHLVFTEWAVSVVTGLTRQPIPMVQIRYSQERRCCPFLFDGLCDLHHRALKPTEGKLAIHLQAKHDVSKSVAWHVAKEWLDPENLTIVSEIIVKMASL